MGNAIPKFKDGTAQGVAKIRHQETLWPPEQRLFYDPYAYAMFPGSIGQVWLGISGLDKIYSWMGLTGFVEMIGLRTKFIDDNIAEQADKAKQLIILGAGYDTRGFRLDFPDDFKVIEVDQPDVQKKKLANLEWLVQKDDENSIKITDRMNSKKVQFVEVDFKQDSLDVKLKAHDGFETNQLSIVLLEGVTQYIPKESTADTLRKLKNVVANGSTILITYVDQNVFDDPSQVSHDPRSSNLIVKMAERTGEPWISGFTKPEMEEFLKDCGYELFLDTTTRDYNEKYLEPLSRKLDEKNLFCMERFVVAKVL